MKGHGSKIREFRHGLNIKCRCTLINSSKLLLLSLGQSSPEYAYSMRCFICVKLAHVVHNKSYQAVTMQRLEVDHVFL